MTKSEVDTLMTAVAKGVNIQLARQLAPLIERIAALEGARGTTRKNLGNFRGSWVEFERYVPSDVVLFASTVWTCTKTHANQIPRADGEHWTATGQY